MKKPMVFEGVVAILIIILLFAMYLMVTGSGGRANNWEINVNRRYGMFTLGMTAFHMYSRSLGNLLPKAYTINRHYINATV